MRKIKIISILLISLIILANIPVISQAAGKFTASISKTTVTVGDTFTVKVNATGAAGKYTVEPSNSNVKITSSGETFLDNNSATWTFKAEKAGTVTITAKTTDMTDLEDDSKEVTGSQSFKVTIKEKTTSSGNKDTNEGKNTSAKEPKFTTVNKKVYTTNDVNLRSSWSTSSSAVQVKNGTELTLTGTSTEIVNGYIWYRVTYKGATKYIASNFVSETKPEDIDYPEDIKSSNNNLKSLKIDGVTLSPEFNSNTLEYTANVGEDITELKVTTETESNRAKATVKGNTNLKSGENTVSIVVTAEDKSTKTYTVKVTKAGSQTTEPETNNSNELRLQSLDIKGVDFSGGFNPEQFSYELSLNSVVSNLTIEAVANREDAKVEILGNSNFVEGENLVSIILSAESSEETVTYQIRVFLPRGVVQEQNTIEFYLKCALIGMGVIVVIIIIILIIRRKKKHSNDYDYADFREETIPTSKMEKEDKKIDSLYDEEESEDKPKRTRGKHSI